MAKLKNIIRQLSHSDYLAIHESLVESNADKSAYLLKAMREKHLSDSKVMEELEVNNNAYYTLRSRLNQKIEEYLLQQMESPRTDLMKKVANITEVIFTKKKAISVAYLQRLEKELLDYDLSHELIIVYKYLKKLHINTPDSYTYSQLYNKHVAYTLAVDKAEIMLSDYFRKYGNFLLTEDEREYYELALLNTEMANVANLYQSHRLYVYQACMNIFHRLFVEEDSNDSEQEPIEDMLDNVQKIFTTYHLDAIYYHLKNVFDFLKHEYYNHYKVYRKAEKYYEDVNEDAGVLLSSYSAYTFPAQFLISKTERCLRLNCEMMMFEENDEIFKAYETDPDDEPKQILYVLYRALSCFYVDKYEETARWINNLLNNISLKRYPLAIIEIKTFLALQYCLMNEEDLFGQLINSIQRQIRILEGNKTRHIVFFIKIMKTALNEAKRDKEGKIRILLNRIHHQEKSRIFSCVRHIKFDDDFIRKLCNLGK